MSDSINGSDNGDVAGSVASSKIQFTDEQLKNGFKPDDLPEGYQDTTKYRRLKNGAVFDLARKRIVCNPGGGISAVKQGVNIKAIYAERVARARLAAQGALAELAIVRDGRKSSISGWARVVGAQAALALDTDRGRASTDAARFVGQATGYLSSDKSDDPGGAASIQDATIGLLAGALASFVHLGGSIAPDNAPDNVVIPGEWVE